MLLLKNKKGQGLVEYLILVAIIGIGSMVVVRSLGQNINVRFAKVIESLGGNVEGGAQADRLSAASLKKKDLRTFMNGSKN